jgi:GMP synthase-like glutamine amidotransferase
MRIPFLMLLSLFIGLKTSIAQTKISATALQEDLNIVKEITLGLSPKLTESDRLQIQMVLDQKKKELDSDSLTTLTFLNFLMDIDINSKFEILGVAEDNTVELIKLKRKKIYGMMWHPERQSYKNFQTDLKKINF